MESDTQTDNQEWRPKTRKPFRIAAMVLGGLFVAFGLYQLIMGPANWIDFGLAIWVALTGLLFGYSAIADQWWAPYGFLRTSHSKGARFLVVEPVSAPPNETDGTLETNPPLQPLNPYSPPRNPSAMSKLSQLQIEASGTRSLGEQFLAGLPFIHYGVVVFLDPNDESTVHAALPLSSSSDRLAKRNVNEAIRVLPEFLGLLPHIEPLVRNRQIAVRMISSYDDLHTEVGARVVVAPDSVHPARGEPYDPP